MRRGSNIASGDGRRVAVSLKTLQSACYSSDPSADMYYTQAPCTPDHSYASSKVSQTLSPPWSEHSFEGPSSPRSPPAAPYMYPVPLPSGATSTAERSYGLMTPPTSPQVSAHVLHPLLIYDASGRIRCDVSRGASSIRLRPSMALSTLDEFASNPSTTRMVINICGSQWDIEILNPRGITVREILTKLCETMSCRVGNPEFHAFDQAVRDVAAASFYKRNGNQFQDGLSRFDFLGGNRFFVGLTKARDGYSWDANFASLA